MELPAEAPLSFWPASLMTARHVSEAASDQSVPVKLARLEQPCQPTES